MRVSNPNVESVSLNRFIVLSIAAHLALVAFVSLKLSWGKQDSLVFEDIVRVDMVALPEKSRPIESDPKPPASDPVPVPARESPKIERRTEKALAAPPKKADFHKTQQSALEKLKALEALDRLAQENEAKEAPAAPKKGNVLSPGTALRGLSKVEYETYLADLDKHIKSHWLLPEWLATGGWKARVRVFIDTKGVVIGRDLVRPSGNPEFDEKALQAVDRSSPLPVPPEKFQALVEVKGVIFGFPD